MSPRDELLADIELAEEMASPESSLSWSSPLGDSTSRERLVSLVDEYAGKELDRAMTDDDDYLIADIGCGDGTFTRDIGERYHPDNDYPDTAVIGIDLSGKYAQVNTNEQDNAIAVGGDAHDILQYMEPFDFVYAVNFLQSADPVETTEYLYDRIRDGGYLAATVPNTDGLPHDASQEDTGTLRYDTAADLPYLRFEDAEVNGRTVTMEQYVFPHKRAERMFESAGFTVHEQETLLTDNSSINKMRNALGLEPQDEPDQETVDLYILEK